jgi:hypothetical protein
LLFYFYGSKTAMPGTRNYSTLLWRLAGHSAMNVCCSTISPLIGNSAILPYCDEGVIQLSTAQIALSGVAGGAVISLPMTIPHIATYLLCEPSNVANSSAFSVMLGVVLSPFTSSLASLVGSSIFPAFSSQVKALMLASLTGSFFLLVGIPTILCIGYQSYLCCIKKTANLPETGNNELAFIPVQPIQGVIEAEQLQGSPILTATELQQQLLAQGVAVTVPTTIEELEMLPQNMENPVITEQPRSSSRSSLSMRRT